jgi:hypothetical protein
MASAIRLAAALITAILLGSVAGSAQATVDVENSADVGVIMVWRVDESESP